MNTGEILIYQNSKGSIKIDVHLEKDTIDTVNEIAIIIEKNKN